MAETIDDIELELEEKQPSEPEIKVEKAEEAADSGKKAGAEAEKREIKPEEGLEELKRKLEAAENARLADSRRARDAEQAAQAAQREVHSTNLSLVDNAIASLKQTGDILEANYAEAAQNGDWAAAAKIQREMAEASAKLLQLEQGKIALESQPEPQIQQRQIDDPVEALASQLSAPSADWVRRHPEYARDQRQFQRMLAAHNLAVGDGIVADTPAYFAAIEETLRITPRREEAEQDPGRRAAPAAAPVSRGGNANGSKPNVVRLTAEEREMAELNGMTDAEYARQKLALQKEGKIH